MVHHVSRWIAGVILFSIGLARGGVGQESGVAPNGVRQDSTVHQIARPIDRLVSLEFKRRPLAEILREIGRQTGLRITYTDAAVRPYAAVNLHVRGMTADEALRTVVAYTTLQLVIEADGEAAAISVSSSEPRRGPSPPDGSISGRITDAKTGYGILGAEISLENTGWRATTDTSGRYQLAEVDSGSYTLTVRRLAYAKQSRKVTVHAGRQDTMNVVLAPVTARLEELVTTATGRQRRLDIANDVTTINADSVLQAAPIRNLADILDGRVPGLTVQRTSGAPGDPARLRLRGASSVLRSNDPIVVVDGVRVYAEQSAARSMNLARFSDIARQENGGSYATPSPLDFIDPNSIETIEVLKGPSAATLYGQDAANGVIIIITKRGRPGPARWSGTAQHGRTEMAGEYPDLFLRRGRLLYNDTPVTCPLTNMADVFPCRGDSVVAFQLLNEPELTVLDRGHLNAGSLTVSGGNQSLTYAVTGSYSDEVGLIKLPTFEADRYHSLFGIAPPSWMQRPTRDKKWAATSTIGARIGPNTDLTLQASLSRSEQQKSSLLNQLGDLMSTYFDRTTGTYYRQIVGGQAAPGGYSILGTPIGSYYERATAAGTQFTNSVNLDYRARRWLTLSANAGLSMAQRADQLFFPRGPSTAGLSSLIDTTGYVNDGQGTSVSSTLNLMAKVLAPIGRGFQFQVAAGANYNGTSTSDVAAGTRNLAPGSSLQGAVITFVRRAESSDATFGYFLAPSVGNSKFNFESGLRLDGGKTYGGAGGGGLSLPKFPKLGFSYLISDEPFFPFKSLFQSFRVRVAYGRASRQPGPTDRLRLYGVPSEVFADGDLETGVELASLGNTEVRPERSSEFEGGFDADLLGNRLSLAVSAYRKTTDDALISTPVAPSVYGQGVNILKNIGVTRNTGLDVTLGAQLARTRLVGWTTSLSVSHRRDIVVELGPDVEAFYVDGNAERGGTRIVPGYPLYGRWTRPILGYADANGNGLLERQEIQLGDTGVYVGATLPNYTATLFTTVSLWQGAVTVDVGLKYEDGLSQQNEVATRLAPFSRGAQVPGTPLVEQVGTIDLASDVPGMTTAKTNYGLIQTVSTTRFNSLSVRYRVPRGVARRLGAQALSIAIQGDNLRLWTNYRGLDPNVNAFGSGNSVTDTGILPQPRTWQIQVHATY